MATNSFTTTTLMISKKSTSSSSSNLALAATRTSINIDREMMMISPSIGRHCCSTNPFVSRIKIFGIRTRRRVISCEVALRSNNSATATSSLSSSSSVTIEDEDEQQEPEKKIGARVRVKVPLKVYHVPRVPEVDLTGKEGHLKQYVALWKGKRISANLPYKVEFVVDIEGRGPVKFFAHLKEDEFEYLD